jgi:hypothetical protein
MTTELTGRALDEATAAAVHAAVRLGIDDAVYRKQDKWRSFPATCFGVDLYALKIELEKSVEQAMCICLRDAFAAAKGAK